MSHYVKASHPFIHPTIPTQRKNKKWKEKLKKNKAHKLSNVLLDIALSVQRPISLKYDRRWWSSWGFNDTVRVVYAQDIHYQTKIPRSYHKDKQQNLTRNNTIVISSTIRNIKGHISAFNSEIVHYNGVS